LKPTLRRRDLKLKKLQQEQSKRELKPRRLRLKE
jgi:hypothetical protein